MRNTTRSTMQTIAKRLPALSGEVREMAEQLLHRENDVMALFRQLSARPIRAMRIRCHGDYHLGQVLWTGRDFVIIDFEGEPRRSLGERNLKRSPLVDVAGMIRSFHYAAHVALGKQRAEDVAMLEPFAKEWATQICECFLKAYLEVTRGASFIPQEQSDLDLLLEAFILDKAIYEIGYELTYRPEMANVPISAVLEIIQAPAGSNGAAAAVAQTSV
jgi:maltose alpha-D-glucosyltransferase/alpha-amylase